METCELVGLKGRYSYLVGNLAAPWNDVGGCYAFARNENNLFHILRIGKADSFKNRPMPPSHECWSDAVTKHGATHILVRVVPTEAERVAEEQDLIAAYNPPMNVHYRTAPLGVPAEPPMGLFGRGLINRSGNR